MTQQMSLHRVLSELKLIDKKINDKISSLELITVKKGDKLLKNINEEEFINNAKSSYESVEALIERRCNLKNALIIANANNYVSINGRTLSIAEAIDYKNITEYKKNLLKVLKDQYSRAIRNYENEDLKNNNALEELIKTAVGNKNDNSESDALIKAMTDGYMSRNTLSYVDPISIKNKIDKLQSEIDEFDSEIDSVLSEANARVTVEV